MVSPDSNDVDRAFELSVQAGSPGAEIRGGLQVRLTAVPAASGLFRERARTWLDDLQWPPQERDDVVAAVCEAVENVTSHAYHARRPGEVLLNAHVERAPQGMRQAVLEVIDHGRWRQAPADPGDRGHGFTIMRASMASVRTVLSDGGTRLEMRSRPVPA